MTALLNALKDFAVMVFGGTLGSGDGATAVTGLVPTFFNWVTTSTVLPYFVIGICVSLVLLAIKIVRGTVWGV